MNDKFKSELEADYPKIVAWDLHRENDLRFLSIFRRDGEGAKRVCGVEVPRTEVEALTTRLESQSIKVGFHDRWAPFVWWVSDQEIFVWDENRMVFHGHEGTMDLIHDYVCKNSEVATVFSFADSTMISRGVRAILKNGDQQMLILHLSPRVKYDPMYNRNQLLIETAWAGLLGQEIARWIGVPYERRI